MSTLKSELENLLRKKVRKEEVKRLIERMYCQYIDDTKYSSKDFKDGSPKIESLYIEINSFYIYVEFEIEKARCKVYNSERYYFSDEVENFEEALCKITEGNIKSQAKKIIPKGNRYMVQLYFSNEYEIEVLE